MNLKGFLAFVMVMQVYSSLPMNNGRIKTTHIGLTFDNLNFDWKAWSLHSHNKKLNIVIEGFEAEEKKKSLAAALHLFYTRLAHHVFDVSALEDTILEKFTYGCLPVADNVNAACFCESDLSINGIFVKPITLTQCISASGELNKQNKMISLGINSVLLSRLEPSDAEEYKKTLLGLSDTLLSPIMDKETKTRQIYLDHFVHRLLALSQKYDWDKTKLIKQAEADIKALRNLTTSRYKKPKLVGFLSGLSIGLTIGFVGNYIFEDYFKNNPKYMLALLGISSFMGGLTSNIVSRVLKART